ncbi:hypothetical protein DMENIID0001_136830 [Sergentomyia squamirostris]
MSEKVEKVRKRKISNSSESEITSVPSKAFRKSENPPRKPSNGEKFSIKLFRKMLEGDDPIPFVRKFLEKATEDRQIVAKYLEAGGQTLEIVTCLQKVDKTALDQISCILNVLHLTVMEILANSPQHSGTAINGCRFLLNKHRGFVETLLESQLTDHRRMALKVLTACVTLDSKMGFQILKLFRGYLQGNSLMEKFAKHRKEEIDSPGSSLRTAYIHFVLSYLMDGNTPLVQNILDKMELLIVILVDLQYDSVENIVLVLGTLRNYVLKKTSVTKTQKFRLFSTEIVGKLLDLYNWKGPQAFHASISGKNPEIIVPAEADQETVSSAIHDFLVLLTTSNKYGITIQCLGNQKTKKNLVAIVVLKKLQTPWKNPLHENLVILLLRACPEQVENFLRARMSYFNAGEEVTLKFIIFLEKMISMMSPKIIQKASGQIGMTEMCSLIRNICLNGEILENVQSKRNLTVKIRLHVTKLLTTMLRQCNSYLASLAEWEVFQDFELKLIKQDLYDHILHKFPKMDSITQSLYRSIEEQKKVSGQEVIEHLEATIDLLTVASETIPSFIDKTTSLINFIQLMGPLQGDTSDPDVQENHSRIELKIIKLILMLDPQVVSPGMPLFGSVLTSFLNIYTFGSVEGGQEVHTLLRSILYGTRLFDSAPLEIDIWLESFKCIEKKDINLVQEFFIKLINRIKSQSLDQGRKVTFQSATERNLDEILDRLERNQSREGIIEIPTMSTLLPVAVDLLGRKRASPVVLKYLEEVIFNLYHYLPDFCNLPQIVQSLALNVTNYMESCDSGKSLTLPCDFSQPEASNLCRSISQKDNYNIDLVGSVQNDGKAFNVICLIIFFHNQLKKLSLLDQDTSDLCGKYIVALLDGVNSRKMKRAEKKTMIEQDSGVYVKIASEDVLLEILRYIFCGQIQLLNNFSAELEDKSRPTINLILQIVTRIKEWNLHSHLQDLTVNYRSKCVQYFRENLCKGVDQDFPEILSAMELSGGNCVDLLKAILVEETNHHDVLIRVLSRVSELKEKALDEDIVKSLCGNFSKLITDGSSEGALNAFADALFDYLTIFHSSIGHVPLDLTEVICSGGKVTKSVIKLATLLLERDESLLEAFRNILVENFTKKELMYPLMNVALSREDFKVEQKLLQKMFAEYKNGIIKSIEKPQKAGVIYRENVTSSVRLIEECMSAKDCLEFTKKSLKPDTVETFQCTLIETIFKKALQTNNPLIHVNFYKNFLNLFTILLKKPTLQLEKLQQIVGIVIEWSEQLEDEVDFTGLLESQIWTNFSRSCLKIGLQQENGDGLLLNFLATLLDGILPDDSLPEMAKDLFEMIFSHSNFTKIILQRMRTDTKTATVRLLLILAKKNPSGFDKGHIPLLLGAYGAKMSLCDRYLLALLHLYEKNGIDFTEYRPFLWSDPAISHYALEKTEEEDVGKVILEEPSMDMVMSIISLDTMKNTLSNFPIWRHLNPLIDLPKSHKEATSTKTQLEMIIDQETPKDEEISEVLLKKPEDLDDVYDPAFFVPLFCAMFAPEVLTSTVSAAQNGLLGLMFEALSCRDEEMRLAAGLALMRYKRQMEGRKEFLDRNVWLHFYGGVQNGLAALGKVTGSSCPRLPHVSANFLAKASIVLTTPLQQLYRPLCDYVLSKESYDLTVVPNFNFMFLSADIDHHNHREFLLGVIADGVKCEEDFNVLELSGALETLMVFFSCPFASVDTNLRILSVINTIVRIPNCSRTLMDKFALIPWLCGIISNLEIYYYDTIEAIVFIIVNLCYSTEYLGDRAGDQFTIYQTALKMIKYLSPRMPQTLLAKFIRVLNNTANGKHYLMNSHSLDHLIECAKPSITNEIITIMNIRRNGAKYTESLAKKVINDDFTKVVIINLYEYVINWTQCNKE